jgi:hypothetical protein
LQKKHKGGIVNKGAIMEIILACVLMYPLYRWLGLPGVALSFVFTTYLQATYYLYHTARVLQVPMLALLPLGNWITKLLIFAALLFFVHLLSTLYFPARIALFLGSIFTILVVMISLYIEIKALRGKNVDNTAQATA